MDMPSRAIFYFAGLIVVVSNVLFEQDWRVARTRELEVSADPRATFAIDYFIYRVGFHAGMLAAALGGLDAFVFTARIGENSATVRARIADKLEWLGAALDLAANAAGKQLISRQDSKVALYVVPTDEELVIARHTLALISTYRHAHSLGKAMT